MKVGVGGLQGNGVKGQVCPKVLVVEDEPLIRLDVASYLAEAGFTVCEAADGEQALELLNCRDDIRAVFTDIEMPGSINGLDLAAVVRETWPDITVIVTSGRVRPNGELPEGADFFEKPYELSRIVDRLSRIDGRNL